MLWQWKPFFCAMSHFTVNNVWSCRKLIKVTAHAIRSINYDVTQPCFQTSKIIYSESRHSTEKRFALSQPSF